MRRQTVTIWKLEPRAAGAPEIKCRVAPVQQCAGVNALLAVQSMGTGQEQVTSPDQCMTNGEENHELEYDHRLHEQ